MKKLITYLLLLSPVFSFGQNQRNVDTVFQSSYVVTPADIDSMLSAVKSAAMQYRYQRGNINLYLPENQAILEVVLNDSAITFEEKKILLTEKIIADWNDEILQRTQYPNRFRKSVTVQTDSKEKAFATYLARKNIPVDFAAAYWVFMTKSTKKSKIENIAASKSIDARLSLLKKLQDTDITKIFLLKGGQAAALFGFEGVNGAIVIEGKKAKKIKSKKHRLF